MTLVVIKLGGSAITDKDKKFSVKGLVIKKIAKRLSDLEEDYILIHGGGSFGHPLASEYEINGGFYKDEQIMGFAKTHQVMERLNTKIVNSLVEAGAPAMAYQTSASTVVKNDEIISMDLRNIKKLVELGIVPVLYGDSVPDLEKGMTILSGDQLLAYIAEKMNASKVVLGTNVEGLYTADPEVDENADLIPKIYAKNWEDISTLIDFSAAGDVTGGMKNKVEVLVKLAKKGIESHILDATEPENIIEAITTDKRIGTVIKREREYEQ